MEGHNHTHLIARERVVVRAEGRFVPTVKGINFGLEELGLYSQVVVF